jgi:hypothetical protein
MNTKGKVALCLFGQPRFLEEGYTTLSKFIDGQRANYEIDVFVHVWWDASQVGTYYSHSRWRSIPHNGLIIRENTIQTIFYLWIFGQ